MKRTILLLCFITTLFAHAQQSDFNTINFKKADTIAQLYHGEALLNIPVLTLRLTAQLPTEAAKFRAIYYWVSHNIKGSYHLTSTNDYKRNKFKNDPVALEQWNAAYRKEVFKKLREDKETLCTGYAYLIKQMANFAGIECEIVRGYGSSNKIKINNTQLPNHSWNAVKLDGNWYLCDATWSAGSIDMRTYEFHFNYQDAFFLMEPVEFAKSHKPLDARWTLLDL